MRTRIILKLRVGGGLLARVRSGALAAAAVVGALALGGCGGAQGDGAGTGRLEVVAGFYPLAFAASEIGGDGVVVTNLTPLGAEPHDLELSPRDVERVRAADLVLYLGAGFQPALEDAVAKAEGRAVDALAELELTAGDPHVWLDPVRYAEIAARVGEALGRPEAARAFSERLKGLDLGYEAGLADCERREIVTSHAAFGYLAERYGLEQISVTGLAPEAEPAPRDLERVARLAHERGATTIFFETLVSPELAETVAREIGAATAVLDPLEGLTDNGAEGDDDYFSIMQSNLAALREALGCR
jgi:zinc transport system substrate-binding protein